MNAGMLCSVPWWAQGLAIIFVAICVMLILLVLLQKGRGGGLASAFGGEGGQSAFGSKTGDVFTWITIGVVVAFGLLAIVLSKVYKPEADLKDNINTASDALAPQEVPATEIPAAPADATVPAPETAAPVDSAAPAAPVADPSTLAVPAVPVTEVVVPATGSTAVPATDAGSN